MDSESSSRLACKPARCISNDVRTLDHTRMHTRRQRTHVTRYISKKNTHHASCIFSTTMQLVRLSSLIVPLRAHDLRAPQVSTLPLGVVGEVAG